MMNRTVLALATVACAALSSTAFGQRQGQAPAIQLSGRAATAICASNQCKFSDTTAKTVLIDYGQPHARGREVFGMLIPFDTIWRLGANPATSLISRIPLRIGQATVPPGSYTLWLRASNTGTSQLVISKTTGVWGTAYSGAANDLARIPMRSRNLTDNVESLQMTLVPSSTAPGTGVLTIAWGKRELSVDYALQTAGAPLPLLR